MYGYPHHVDPATDDIMLDHLEGYEQPDETSYVLRLRSAVRFQDAAPGNRRSVTADDVVLSMRRYRDSALTVNKFWHAKILRAEGAPDSRTIVLSLQRPYVYTMAETGHINAGAIVPREAIDQQIDLRAGGSGSGPLQPNEASASSDGAIRLRRFEGHSLDAAFVDAMEWRYFEAAELMFDALRSRSADIVPARSRKEAAALRDELGGLRVVREPSLSTYCLGLKVDRPPFNDERTRRALDLLVDRAELIRAAGLEPDDGHSTGPVNVNLAGGYWAFPSANESTDGRPIEDKRAVAASLLQAAGSANATFALQAPNAPEVLDVAAAVREQLSAAGLRVALEPLPSLTSFVRTQRGDFSAMVFAQPPYETPDGALRWYHSGGPNGDGSPSGLSDAELDALIERSWAERDRAARRDAVLTAQRLAVERRPLLQLFAASGYTCAWSYVRDDGLELPGSLARYHYKQWLELPVSGRAD
jgi:peptide/nickel transport system substrate-binding protein